MRKPARVLAACLFACSGGTDTTDTMGDMTDTDDAPTGCTTLIEGGWTANGSCFGHEMTATLTLGTDECTFTMSGWSMAMTNTPPTGGTVEGSDVTLDGADWTDCTGATDGSSINGTCPDGCGFDLISDG